MALGTLPTKGLSQTTAHNYQCQCLKFLCFIGFIITLPISNSVSCPGIQQNQSGEETKKGRPKPSRGSYVPMIGSLEVSGVTQDIRPWGGHEGVVAPQPAWHNSTGQCQEKKVGH